MPLSRHQLFSQPWPEKLLYENIRGYEPIETIDEKLNTKDEKEDELK